jgi:coenzyme F420-reducing hydrogenase alpha subunit
MSRERTRTLRTAVLARVEGEGGLRVRIRDGRVRDVELCIFEPPRLFEPLLEGRDFREVPDLTARICGICPVAYQMSAVQALERLCGVEVGGPLRDLRRMLFCGEWIESHVLHLFFLHLPDFLGYDGVISMAADHREVVETALRLKKIGNRVVAVLGGREIHPVNVRVGGFYRVPEREELLALRDDLAWGRDAAANAVRRVAGLEFPDLTADLPRVALRHPGEYPLTEGRIVSDRGLDIDVSEFDSEFAESQVERSNALHAAHRRDGAYLVGPMARFALDADRLDDETRSLAREVGLEPGERNPFRSIVVRALETFWAFGEALRVVDGYRRPDVAAVEVEPRAGTGHGCSEAPRGICWHRYRIDGEGRVEAARIVPPTSQNQAAIEADLRTFVETHLDLPDDLLGMRCEQVVRNHDPCISCATHALRVEIDRG